MYMVQYNYCCSYTLQTHCYHQELRLNLRRMAQLDIPSAFVLFQIQPKPEEINDSKIPV